MLLLSDCSNRFAANTSTAFKRLIIYSADVIIDIIDLISLALGLQIFRLATSMYFRSNRLQLSSIARYAVRAHHQLPPRSKTSLPRRRQTRYIQDATRIPDSFAPLKSMATRLPNNDEPSKTINAIDFRSRLHLKLQLLSDGYFNH